MANIPRIKGTKGRLLMCESAQDLDTDGARMADCTSFTLDESAENNKFFVIDAEGEQTGEGSESGSLQWEGIYHTEDPGQSLLRPGQLRKWRFYPAHGDDSTVYAEGFCRISNRSLQVQAEESTTWSASADLEGLATYAGMW